MLFLLSFFLSCSSSSSEKYSLALHGQIVVKNISYETAQEHLRKYPEHDYQVYSEAIGEWKPWRQVVDLNAKPKNTTSDVGAKANDVVSGLFGSNEEYSLALDGKILVKNVSYEDLQAHLRQYSEYDYQVYSDSVGEWKPWKDVIELNAKPQTSKNGASASKEESSSFADLISVPDFLSGGNKLALPAPKDPFLSTTIPAGSYTMGCNVNEGDTCKREYALDAHDVKISNTFEIMNTAISVGTYREIMGEYPREIMERDTKISFNSGYIAEVSKSKAIQFANALSQKQGLEECYYRTEEKTPYAKASVRNSYYYWLKGVDCKGWRLPTEAEWEYVYKHLGFKKLGSAVIENYCTKLRLKIEPEHSRCHESALPLQHFWQKDELKQAAACEHIWDAYLTNHYRCDDVEPDTKREKEKTCRRYPLQEGTISDPIRSYRPSLDYQNFSLEEWTWRYDQKPDERKLEVIKTISGKNAETERVVGAFGRALPIQDSTFYTRCEPSAIRLVRTK